MAIDPTTAIVGKTLWLRGKDLGAGGSTVTSWTDQAGTGLSIPASGTPSVVAAATPSGGKAVSFPGSTDQFLGNAGAPPIAASSYFSTSFLPSNLLDGSTGTSWSTASGVGTGWARIFLNTAYAATSYVLTARGGATGDAPKDFTFEGSNDDGATWTVLDTQVGVVWSGVIAPVTFTITNSTAYRSYRLNVTAAGTQVQLSEFSIPGATPSPAGEAWLVVKGPPTSAAGNNASALGGGTATTALFRYTNGDIYDLTGRSARKQFTPTAPLAAQWYLIRVTSDGTWTYYIDGVSQSTEAVAATWRNNPQIRLTNGQIAEILVLSGVRTSGEVADLITYFNTEHGLTVPGGSTASTTGAANLSGLLGVVSGAGVVTVAGAASAVGPLGTLAATGFGPTTGGAVLTGPLGSLTAIGVVVTTGDGAMTGPLGTVEALGTADNTAIGLADLTGPLGVLTAAGTVITLGAADLAGPLGTVAAVGDSTPPSVDGANLTGPLGTLTAEGVSSSPPVVVSTTRTPVGILSVLPLVPVTPLADAVPITRVSILAPNLSESYPVHPAPGEAGAPEVIEEVVGYPQLFIGGRNVTNLRGVQTLIRRWESESPFGDTAAAFEFPQLNPWDQPGAGDLEFLGRDAPVAIGIREEVAPGAFRVRRLWSGFLDARGNGLGEGEDYAWEAKGTFWQAQSFLREPHPLPASEPVDIGVWIARVMNAVDGRRWATMPLTPIGITTRTRGHRGQYAMEYVQELLSEAITDDFRQWTLVEVAPGVPRLVLKPAPTEVHATVAYGTPGVDIDLRIDQSTRVDRIFMRGIGKNAGGWANIFYPWLYKIDDAPPYPMADPATNITLGTTDADTVSGSGVTDFQRRVDELDGFANPAVSGVMSAAWMAVVDDLQRRLNLPVGPLNAATWERVFDGRPNLEGIKPRRLPMASKPEAEKYLYDADGRRLPGVNPAWDGRVPRDIDIDAGVGKGKAEGFKLARKILGLFGDAAANGQIVWTTDPKETDRTRLSHLSNIKVTGFEGRDVVVQVSQKSVELDDGDKAYVVTTRVDERARDAMVVEDLLNQRREAKADPSRRPGVTNRASRQVEDQRTPWDSESPCGKLRRTAVPSGGWRIRHIPFAEVGKLASISIDSTRPFSFAIFASLRVTEAHLNAKGSPFASADFWRDNKAYFDGFGIVEAWGEKDDACGYSPKSEADGGGFTGKFRLDTPVDYWTETPPVVAVAFYMRGGSGWVEGGQDADGVRRGFIPAYES